MLLGFALYILCLTETSHGKQILYEALSAGAGTSTAGTSTFGGSGYDKYVGTKAYGGIKAVYHNEDFAIRYLAEGTQPTSSVGVFVGTGSSFSLDKIEDIRRCRIIGIGGTSSVKIEYSEVKEDED